MTFYNVLSALLFLGSLRVFLMAVDNPNWPNIFMAACLCTLVFNDMLSTSHVIEVEEEVKYTMSLMLIDLINFLLLALALITISPEKNLFDVPLPTIASTLSPHFWFLLTVYWLLLIWWTYIWRKRLGESGGWKILRYTVAIAFFVEWLVTLLGLTSFAKIGRPVVLGYLLVYLCFIRPWARRELAQPRTTV